ncbi:MAG: S8 family serine peptidase [Acidobacteriia bacterium]|nr:S8 family serine peptidase [Terriglobia bacterium]
MAPRGEGRLLMHSAEAEQHRARIRSGQAAARTEIERGTGRVTGAVENALNALMVSISDADAAQLSAIPGVVRVYPERMFHLLLDHALPLHKVPDAWAQVGIANAGAGVKIALIDTGIDIGHPGFNDAGFQAPSLPADADASAPRNPAFQNNKVIVARSYVGAADPDPSPADHVGHGTATAMAAGGVSNTGPLATISGVAPRAFLGNYRVFPTPTIANPNPGASDSAILKAIDDAVADGMDVISMSLGSDVYTRLGDDPEVQSLDTAASLGVIVVVAAGNNGADPATIASPAIAPAVIAVGASNNDRIFAASAQPAGGSPLLAIPGSASTAQTPAVTATLVDVTTLDGNGLACSPLPANSLKGVIAFIERGTPPGAPPCTFEIKLNNAQAAGATAALVYNNVAGPPIGMAVGAATLPAEMVSNADGLALQQRLQQVSQAAPRPRTRRPLPRLKLAQPPLQVTLQFALGSFRVDPDSLAPFSAAGPNVDFAIKPDLVAVGENMYTAAEKLDPLGEIFSLDGYSVEQGTSFSTPLVAGAAALLKAARPGLTAAQYRSLLIDTAAPAFLTPGVSARVQQAGGGLLDALAALNATAAAAPVSLSFSVAGGALVNQLNLTISNVGTAADTFQLSVTPRGGGPVPQLPATSVPLAAGASTTIAVQLQTAGLVPGQYEGFINIQGTHASAGTHVPYWFAAASGQPQNITVLANAGTNGAPRAGARVNDALIFRVTDAAGLPVANVQPVVAVASGGGRIVSTSSFDSTTPDAFTVTVVLGPQAAVANVFSIQAGNITRNVTILGN